MTSIYPILGLDKEPKKVKSKEKSQPKQEISSLLEQYKTLLEVAEKISSTLLIKHNTWIIQIKSIRQHYLFETEEALTEEQSMANCAIEISSREGSKQNAVKTLYSIRCSDDLEGLVISNEQTESSKTLQIKLEGSGWIAKLVSALK